MYESLIALMRRSSQHIFSGPKMVQSQNLILGQHHFWAESQSPDLGLHFWDIYDLNQSMYWAKSPFNRVDGLPKQPLKGGELGLASQHDQELPRCHLGGSAWIGDQLSVVPDRQHHGSTATAQLKFRQAFSFDLLEARAVLTSLEFLDFIVGALYHLRHLEVQ